MNTSDEIIEISEFEPHSCCEDGLESRNFIVQGAPAGSRHPLLEPRGLSALYCEATKLYLKLFQHYIAILYLTVALWILPVEVLGKVATRTLRACAAKLSKVFIATLSTLPVPQTWREKLKHTVLAVATQSYRSRIQPVRWILKKYQKAAGRIEDSRRDSGIELTQRCRLAVSPRHHSMLEPLNPTLADSSRLLHSETDFKDSEIDKPVQRTQQTSTSNVAAIQPYPEAMDLINLSGSWTVAGTILSDYDERPHLPSISEPAKIPISHLPNTTLPMDQLPVSAPEPLSPEIESRPCSVSPSYSTSSTKAASFSSTQSILAPKLTYLQARSAPTSPCKTFNQHHSLFWDSRDKKDVERRRERTGWYNTYGSIKADSTSEMEGSRHSTPVKKRSKIPKRVA